MKDLLTRSFDESLTDKEQVQLDTLLSKSAEWREAHHELQYLRQQWREHEASYRFSPFFADKVLRRIAEQPSMTVNEPGISDLLIRYFPRVAVAGLAAMLFLVLQLYRVERTWSLDTIAGIQTLEQEYWSDDGDYLFY